MGQPKHPVADRAGGPVTVVPPQQSGLLSVMLGEALIRSSKDDLDLKGGEERTF